MLTQLSVANYRCFVNRTDVPLAPMTFLFGPNGSGKTALLDALYQIATLASGNARPFESIFRPFGPYSLQSQATHPNSPVCIELNYRHEFGVANTMLRYALRLEEVESRPVGEEELWIDDRRVAISAGPTSSISTMTLDDPDEQAVLSGFIDWIRFLRRYRISPGQARDRTSLFDNRWIATDGSHLASAIDHLYQDSPVNWQNFLELFRELFPAIADVSASFDPVGCGIQFTTATGRQLVGAHLSDGQAVGMAVAFLLTSPRAPRVLCFEELENGLSPKVLRLLLNRMLSCVETNSPVKQIISTTHSPFAISWADDHAQALQLSSTAKVRRISEVEHNFGVTLHHPIALIDACGLLENEWYT